MNVRPNLDTSTSQAIEDALSDLDFGADPEADLEIAADSYRHNMARCAQRIADTKRETRDKVSALEAKRKELCATYERMMASLRDQVTEAKAIADRHIAADKKQQAMCKAALEAAGE